MTELSQSAESADPNTTAPTQRQATAGLGRRAARNAALVLVARVASRLVALVAVILMSRRLGADRFGVLQTLVTYTAVVGAISDLGCNTLFIREAARHHDLLERYLRNVLSIRVLISVPAFGLLTATLLIPGLLDLLLPAFALTTLAAYANLLRGAFYASQRLGFEAIDIVLESAVLLGLTLFGAATGQGVAYYVLAYAASYAAACVFFSVALAATGMARLGWRLDRELLRPWLVAGVPLALTYVMSTLYFKIDVPIMQRFRPYDEVGWYTLAYRPFEALLFLPLTVRTVLFPVMSIYFRSSARHLTASIEKLYKALLVVGLPIGLLIIVLAPGISGLLHLYPESTPALRVLGIAVVVVFVNNTAPAALNAMDRQNSFATLALCDLVVNIVLNLIFIPRYGYIAAAWTTVATEWVSAVVSWVLLARWGERLAIGRVSLRPLAAGAIMAAVLIPFRDSGGAVVVGAGALAVAVYGAALLLLRGIDAEERSLLRSAIGRGG